MCKASFRLLFNNELLIIFKSRGHTGVIISLMGRRLFQVEKQFGKYTFLDWKEARFSQDFSDVESLFQISGATTEKARLPRFSLVLGI